MKYLKNAIWKLQMYHHYTAKKSNFYCFIAILRGINRNANLPSPCIPNSSLDPSPKKREESGTMRVGIVDYCISVQPVGIKSGQYR